MYKVKQGFFTVGLILALSPLTLAETLSDIYKNALQNDPVLRAARANFNAGKENGAIS